MPMFRASIPFFRLCSLCLLLFAATALAAEPGSNSDAAWWNLVISLIVIVILLFSAALPVAALRQWTGNWRIAAALPLLLLAIWVAVIALSRLADGNTHRLWALELFAWAMLNMIYMVAVMTFKRQLDKALPENNNDG